MNRRVMAVVLTAFFVALSGGTAQAKKDCGDVSRKGHTAYDVRTSGTNCQHAREVVARYIRTAHPGTAKIVRHGRRANRCSWKTPACTYGGGYRHRTQRVVRWKWTVPWNTALASWYDADGLGGAVACGGGTGGYFVAHKSLPCGTRLVICHQGCVEVDVRDRGPFVGPREFDIDATARSAIGFDGVGTIRYRLLR